MAITTTLSGPELANYLARHLSDLEFELLIRTRIKIAFDDAHSMEPNLAEHHNSCTFSMSWGDEGKWHVGIGESYSKSADTTGQVLGNCMSQVQIIYRMKNLNKLSFLLEAPEATPHTDDC